MKRRTFLRSGASLIALPFLESTSLAARAVEDDHFLDRRVFFMYTPNGVISSQWRPTEAGESWETRGSLAPLAAVKKHVSVISGLSRKRVPGQVHGQACCCWLTSARPEQQLPGPFPIDTSLDQIIAQDKADATLYGSVALSCNDFKDNHESVYFDSISWFGPGQAAMASNDPRQMFNRLFRVSTDTAVNKSILDALLEDTRSLKRSLGRVDNARVDEFLNGVRETERLVQRREQILGLAGEVGMTDPERPERRGDYIRTMCSLVCHAFEMDLTRVATLVVDPERWSSPRMFHGLFDSPQNHHMLTHDDSEAAAEKVAAIDRFHVQIFSEVIQNLSRMQARSGKSLLDDTLVVMGSGLGDGYTHSLDNLPILLGGSAGGTLKTGRHIVATEGTPLANLWLTIRNSCGQPADTFADSTGVMSSLLT